MQLRQLETFVTIAEAETLTEAARRLYKTQGAVSHDLKSLERECGTRLVDRSGQRAKLTAAGRHLLPHARGLLQRVTDIERTMREVGESGHPEVRLGVLPSLAGPAVDHVESFRAAQPGVEITFLTALRHELIAWLYDGRIDVIVADAAIETGVVAAHVGVDPIGVVMHRDLAHGMTEPVTAEAVRDLPLVAFDLELGTTPGAEVFFRSLGRYPQAFVRVSDQHVMRAFLAARAGYGIMPLAACANDAELVRLRTEPELERGIVILRHQERLLSPTAERFFEHIVSRWRAASAG